MIVEIDTDNHKDHLPVGATVLLDGDMANLFPGKWYVVEAIQVWRVSGSGDPIFLHYRYSLRRAVGDPHSTIESFSKIEVAEWEIR